MTRRKYDFMDVKPRCLNVLFLAAVVLLLLGMWLWWAAGEVQE